MKVSRISQIAAVPCLLVVTGCKTGKPILTREVFEQAAKACHPLASKFTLTADPDQPPIVEVTVPETPSPIADCMARAFDGSKPRIEASTAPRE